MSGRLVGEVHAWLRTPRAQALGLNVSQRMVLSTIAERAHERTREMWSHATDGCSQFEYLMEVTGLKRSALAEALNGLAEKQLEVRIKVGETAKGKPIFAHRGKATRFRLPTLPAAVALPTPGGGDPREPVDNPGDNPPEEPAPEDESLRPAGTIRTGSLRHTGTKEAKASGTPEPNGPKASGTPDPSPYKDTPYKDLSLTPVDPSSHLNLEAPQPAAATPTRTTSTHMGFDAEYQTAVVTLTRFPDFGDQFITQARAELGDTADRQQTTIRAAQIAQEGIPA